LASSGTAFGSAGAIASFSRLGNSGSCKTLSADAGGAGGTISGSGIASGIVSAVGSSAGGWLMEGWVLGGSGSDSATASALTGGVVTASAGASSMRDSTTATCILWN
jgi:hypothetical protein